MGFEGRSRKVPVEFRESTWSEEVGRLDRMSWARVQAEKARSEVEAGRARPDWRACQEEGSDGTWLPLCMKLYVPIGQEGATAAPLAFVFRLEEIDAGVVWRMIAFGERHPANPKTHSVYARAHRRIHGRYP